MDFFFNVFEKFIFFLLSYLAYLNSVIIFVIEIPHLLPSLDHRVQCHIRGLGIDSIVAYARQASRGIEFSLYVTIIYL